MICCGAKTKPYSSREYVVYTDDIYALSMTWLNCVRIQIGKVG